MIKINKVIDLYYDLIRAKIDKFKCQSDPDKAEKIEAGILELIHILKET